METSVLIILGFSIALMAFSIGQKWGYRCALDDMVPVAADTAVVTTVERLEKTAVEMGYDNILSEIISATFAGEKLRKARERVKTIY